MDAHFWPSMYPGLIIGLIYGFSRGGYVAPTAGAAGGLAGAIAAYFAIAKLGLEEGLPTLALLVALALACAHLLILAAGILRWGQSARGGTPD